MRGHNYGLSTANRSSKAEGSMIMASMIDIKEVVFDIRLRLTTWIAMLFHSVDINLTEEFGEIIILSLPRYISHVQ